jgi:hypothetical protein
MPYADDDDDDDDDMPLAARAPPAPAHTNGVKAEMPPPAPPLSSIPAPNNLEPDRNPSATPPAQKPAGGLKLKIKFGGGGGSK